MGGSTPIVWGDRLFLTSEDDGDLVLSVRQHRGQGTVEAQVGSGRFRARDR